MAAYGCHASCWLLLHLHQKLQQRLHWGGTQKHSDLLLCHVCGSRCHAGLVERKSLEETGVRLLTHYSLIRSTGHIKKRKPDSNRIEDKSISIYSWKHLQVHIKCISFFVSYFRLWYSYTTLIHYTNSEICQHCRKMKTHKSVSKCI